MKTHNLEFPVDNPQVSDLVFNIWLLDSTEQIGTQKIRVLNEMPSWKVNIHFTIWYLIELYDLICQPCDSKKNIRKSTYLISWI